MVDFIKCLSAFVALLMLLPVVSGHVVDIITTATRRNHNAFSAQIALILDKIFTLGFLKTNRFSRNNMNQWTTLISRKDIPVNILLILFPTHYNTSPRTP